VILGLEFPLMSKEMYAMAAVPSIDAARLLEEQLESASPDLLRSMLSTFIQALMSPRPTRSPEPPTARVHRSG
jgi:hypothetical protein